MLDPADKEVVGDLGTLLRGYSVEAKPIFLRLILDVVKSDLLSSTGFLALMLSAVRKFNTTATAIEMASFRTTSFMAEVVLKELGKKISKGEIC